MENKFTNSYKEKACISPEKVKEGTSSTKQSLFTKLPNDIIENDVLSYLNTKELFFSVRLVCTDWSEHMKNIWCNKIKEEMVEQVKSIDLVYEKEVVSKTYEFKLKYLLNYKNLLSMYLLNTNISNVLNTLVPHLESTTQIKMLMIFFFKFILVLPAEELVINNNYAEITEYLINNQNQALINTNMLTQLAIDYMHPYTLEQLGIFKNNFSILNKEFLEHFSENCKLGYSFLLGLIEYQLLKHDIKALKERINRIIESIQESVKIWPKKRLFYERAYKLLLFSRNSSEGTRKLVTLFESLAIKHPIIEYHDGCLKLIIDLKRAITDPLFDKDKLEDTLFDNILSRRILLSRKIVLIERFHEIYTKAFVNENKFIIRDEEFSLKELLWSFKFACTGENEEISEDITIKTKKYLDDYFDYEKAIVLAYPKNLYESAKSLLSIIENFDSSKDDEKAVWELIDDFRDKVSKSTKINPNGVGAREVEVLTAMATQNRNINLGPNTHLSGNSTNIQHNDRFEREGLFVDKSISHQEIANQQRLNAVADESTDEPKYCTKCTHCQVNRESESNNRLQEQEEPSKSSQIMDQGSGSTSFNRDEFEGLSDGAKQAEITSLKNQKKALTEQKERTEKVLTLLKKFLEIKESVINNSKRYKYILFILAKTRGQDIKNLTFETIQSLIQNVDINQILENTGNNLTENDIQEIERFEASESLLSRVESQLFKYVDQVLKEVNK